MKRQLVLILFLPVCLLTYSQNEYNRQDNIRTNNAGDKLIFSVSPNVLLNTPNGTQIAGGIKAQVFIDKRFSLDADLLLSRDYIHFSSGIAGISLFLIGSGLSGGSWFPLALFFLALSFEHISYHIPVNNTLDIAPYVSILRYKFSYKSNDPSNQDFAGEQFCFVSGVQINKYFGRFVLAPYTEYSIGYKDHISGLNFGVYCGVLFQGK